MNPPYSPASLTRLGFFQRGCWDNNSSYIPLSSINETNIGRNPGSCTLDSDFVSRVHLGIWFHAGKWLVQDYNSLNGTYLLKDGQTLKVEPNVPQELHNGALIGIGINPEEWKNGLHMTDQKYYVYLFQNAVVGSNNFVESANVVNSLCQEFSGFNV